MSELAEPIGARGGEEGLLDRLVAVRLQVNWQLAAYAALIVVAGGMRFWDLGTRALHHDESLHAWTAWKLFQGQGYEHQPWMHGPLQFFGTAASFFLFGVSDYTARILPAVAGSAAVALPFFLRKRLGAIGALLAAAGIAFSPTLLYFSRFARNDVYIALFTLGLVACLWRYVDERKPLYLYIAALVLGISFATNESTFINAAVLVVFLNVWLAVRFWRQLRDRNELDGASSASVLALLLPSAWAVVALWPFTNRWRDRVGLRDWHPAASFLIVIGTLTLPQFAAAVLIPLESLFSVSDASLARAAGSHTRENVLGLFTIAGLVAASAAVGLRWNLRVWGIAALLFYIPYALLYTSLFTNMDGFYSGHWGSLDYWLSQQDVARGQQPWFYYLMLIPAYEFLPLAFAAPALFYWTLRGDVFRGFLVFWFVATVFGYSVAGEKMPWISVYPTLPLVLIAAVFLGDVLAAGLPQRAASRLQPYAEPLAAAALGALAVALGVFGPSGGGWVALRILLILAASVAVIWLLMPVDFGRSAETRTKGRRRAAGPFLRESDHRRTAALGCAALAGGLLAASLFVAVRLTYQYGDVPRELLVYTQTSPYVPDIVESIEAAGRQSGLNHDLPIVIEGGIEPWTWYLRDYRPVYRTIGANFPPPPGAVVILLASNEQAMQPFAGDYDQPVRFPLRWWYPEFDTYKTAPTAGVIRGVHPDVVPRALDWFLASLFRSGTWETWWNYMRYRDPPGTTTTPEDRLGRLDMLAYFPKQYAVEVPDVTQPPAPGTPTTAPTETIPPPVLPPEQPLTVELTIGRAGTDPGMFNQPGGVALDSAGNLYVADVLNYRVQKFDPTGKFLTQVGGRGRGDGQFEEPWGMAVDGQGNVYVADTFNHRIQKFDADLKFLLAWGKPASSLDAPEQDAFWGPRDVAIDANGDVWITDGGTGRVLRYSADGRFIAAFAGPGNGPGQFVEPTSIEIAASGDIFVADNGNRRVQRFDAAFTFIAQYAVPGWLHVDSLVKPYIALLPDAGFVVSDPTQNKLIRFDAEGKPIATLDAAGAPLQLPRGLAFDREQALYVAEAQSNQVRRLTLAP